MRIYFMQIIVCCILFGCDRDIRRSNKTISYSLYPDIIEKELSNANDTIKDLCILEWVRYSLANIDGMMLAICFGRVNGKESLLFITKQDVINADYEPWTYSYFHTGFDKHISTIPINLPIQKNVLKKLKETPSVFGWSFLYNKRIRELREIKILAHGSIDESYFPFFPDDSIVKKLRIEVLNTSSLASWNQNEDDF